MGAKQGKIYALVSMQKNNHIYINEEKEIKNGSRDFINQRR